MVNGERRLARIHVRRDDCKGCRFCVDICPCDEAACVACRRCETICPELAIYIEPA